MRCLLLALRPGRIPVDIALTIDIEIGLDELHS